VQKNTASDIHSPETKIHLDVLPSRWIMFETILELE